MLLIIFPSSIHNEENLNILLNTLELELELIILLSKWFTILLFNETLKIFWIKNYLLISLNELWIIKKKKLKIFVWCIFDITRWINSQSMTLVSPKFNTFLVYIFFFLLMVCTIFFFFFFFFFSVSTYLQEQWQCWGGHNTSIGFRSYRWMLSLMDGLTERSAIGTLTDLHIIAEYFSSTLFLGVPLLFLPALWNEASII